MRAPARRSRMIYTSEMEIYLIMNQNSSAPRLILASGSPRRRELLAKMGYTFEICVPDVDEHAVGHARDIVATLSQRKARAAAEHYREGTVIASDALVSYQGAPLGKPRRRGGRLPDAENALWQYARGLYRRNASWMRRAGGR